MGKNFKKDTASLFLSEAPEPEQTGQEVPRGYKLVKESKSGRINLLVRPSTKEALKEEADRRGISTNELINKILEDYIEDQEGEA